MVCWDLTLSGSLFYSTGMAVAKPRLPMTFLGWTDENDSLFALVRELDLIKDDKERGWETFFPLKIKYFVSEKDRV